MILYLVANDVVAHHPIIADLADEGLAFLADGWRLPVGLLDHCRRHQDVMDRAEIAPLLLAYYVRQIIRQPNATAVLLPQQHPGHTYLGLMVGTGVWRADDEITLQAFRDEILECFLARELMWHASAMKACATMLEKTFSYDDHESALSQISISSDRWDHDTISPQLKAPGVHAQ